MNRDMDIVNLLKMVQSYSVLEQVLLNQQERYLLDFQKRKGKIFITDRLRVSHKRLLAQLDV